MTLSCERTMLARSKDMGLVAMTLTVSVALIALAIALLPVDDDADGMTGGRND